jgi:hypothetical protein
MRCFNTSEGNHGWCGTCDPAASGPGQPGYCGKNSTKGREEAVVVEADRKWGFCNRQGCDVDESKTLYLHCVFMHSAVDRR